MAWDFPVESSPLLRPSQGRIEIAAALYIPTCKFFEAILINDSIFQIGVRVTHDRLSKILQAMSVVMRRHVRMLGPVPIIVDSVS